MDPTASIKLPLELKLPPPRVLTAEQWLELDLKVDAGSIVLGSREQAIVRVGTKNVVEAAEKSYKTTFLLRVMQGLAAGVTIYKQLPVLRPSKVLYVHGELTDPEIKERTLASIAGLDRPLSNFLQVRDPYVHLITPEGRKRLIGILNEVRPDQLVLDPWQAFIYGFDENSFEHVSLATHFLNAMIDHFKLTSWMATHTGKDSRKGTRGHSSLAGWRDTLFRMKRTEGTVNVKIEPRWAAPVEPFNLHFQDGILVPGAAELSPQSMKIRAMVGKSREDAAAALGLKDDALRKAIQRAGCIVTDSGTIMVAGLE